jgi:membrane protein CcdC involved in cytochrome C biogenesis
VTFNRTLERTAPVRLRDVVLARTPGAPLVLVGLMLLAFVVRMWLNTRVEAPWLMGDELTYSEMAKSFAAGHGLEVRAAPPNVRTLYPVLISPAWLLDSVQAAYGAAKTINTVAMTLAAIPLYLWARRLVSSGWALAAATLLLLMPAFAYSGMIMTESAFLPLFLIALYTLARAL